MKIKQLLSLAAFALMGGANLWAQDVYKDVTSTYLKNADLDGDYTSLQKLNSTTLSSRTFQQPSGWSLYVSTANSNDASFLTKDDNASSYTSNIASQITLPEKNDPDGDRKLVVRINNSGSNRRFEFYQQVTLPIGTYKISGQFNNKNTGCMRTGVYYGSSDDSNKRAQVMSSNSKDQWVTVEKTFTMSAESQISIGFYFTQLNSSGWGIAGANDIKLEYNLTKALTDTIEVAKNAKIAGDKSKYLNALEDAIKTAEGYKTSQEANELQQAINDLQEAIDDYKAKENIIKAIIEIARAEAYSVVKTENTTAYTNAIQAAKDAIDEDVEVDYSDVIRAMQNFKVEDYNWVKGKYTERKTIGSWTGQYQPSWGETSQHWSGTSITYSNNYENNMSRKGSQKITLPKGDYVFYAIGRSDVNAMTYIKVEEETVNFTPKGAEGLGVDKTGAANFTIADDTYANENKGFGWEYRFIPFHLNETTEVTLEFGYYYTKSGEVWGSISEPMLYMTSDTKAFVEAYEELGNVIKEAPAAKTTNVGAAAFQFPESVNNTYQTTLNAANTAYSANDATVASLNQAKEALQSAIETFNTTVLIAPTAGQKFNFTLGGSNSWTGKAITYIAGGRADQGNYGVAYEQEPNAIYAQAFTMTQVEGNKYKMSQTDVDGNERYLCTGTVYGGNNYQIRTTTTANNALVVEIVPTNTEGVYNLKNTAANANIGSKDNGVYTNDGNGTYVVDFAIAEASQASANLVVTDAKWGTFIAPFNAEIPEGVKVKVYKPTLDGNNIVPGDEKSSIVANTPYLIKSDKEVNETLHGWGLATKDQYEDEYGVYGGVLADKSESTEAAKYYILQKHGDNVAFYYCNPESEPTYKFNANRCYFKLSASNPARLDLNIGDDETSINNIEQNNAIANGKYIKGKQIVIVKNGRHYNVSGQIIK